MGRRVGGTTTSAVRADRTVAPERHSRRGGFGRSGLFFGVSLPTDEVSTGALCLTEPLETTSRGNFVEKQFDNCGRPAA